jgi:outer membrane receptor protein involved in Fe transport
MSVATATHRRRHLLISASLISILSIPAFAQSAPQNPPADETAGLDTIVVTAQRQSQSLQDVPIAVSAFSPEALEKSGIEGASDIQFALPNVTFTKTNFTSQSFQIRGVGSNAVGAATEGSTGIHVNDIPISGARIFETEFFDVERIEVLRGPQGTQFGRNATGGVLNVITKKPTSEYEANLDLEYGNFESLKVKGAVNIPMGETLGFRASGIYISRDGYTKNLFTGDNIDGRDQFALRGAFRWEPTENTTLDFTVQHFKENSNRSRTGKQLCNRDVTGVYGCLPDRLETETLNNNATLAAILSSSQFFSVLGLPSTLAGGLALNNLAGPDLFAGVANPSDLRTVRVDYDPTYKTKESLFQLNAKHDFDTFSVKFNAGYSSGSVDSTSDYNLAAGNPITKPALIANPALGGAIAPYLSAINAALFQGNNIGVSNVQANSRENYVGFIGGPGNILRYASTTTDYDRSTSRLHEYSFEAIVNTQLDGPFNALLGGIYSRNVSDQVDFYVAGSALDYASAVLGLARALAAPGTPPQALASPYFNSQTEKYILTGKAVFGELYYEPTDELKLTVGLRYLEDTKFLRDRQVLLNTAVPLGTQNALPIIFNPTTGADADLGIPGRQAFRERREKFSKLIGRAVIDFKPELSFTDDTLIYASFTRGFKSGGINPPFDPSLFPSATVGFDPETINAYEIGTKNRFADGKAQFNLTGFYYDYKGLQISSIVQRTSFNDNVDAKIWGLEADMLYKPMQELTVGVTASYLKTKLANKQVLDPSNPTAGRSDALLIKDLTNAANCVALPTTAGANVAARLAQIGTFYNTLLPTVNAVIANPNTPAATRAALQPLQAGLNGTANAALAAGGTAFPVPGTNHAGNYGVCAALSGAAAVYAGAASTAQSLGLGTIVPGATAGFTVSDGVLTDITGNELQNSPKYKFNIFADYTVNLENEWSVNARVDYAYTAKFWGSYYNRGRDNQVSGGTCSRGGATVLCGDRIPGYGLLNAQIRLSGPDNKWAVRGFVQNLFDKNAITGLYTTDQSSGLFRNAFLVEPRRYGIGAEVRF